MNSKTNRTLFIIIALLGSVKNSYATSNQLAIRGTHERRSIKGAKTFESPNPFAVLEKMNDKSDSLSSSSDAHSINRLAHKRPSQKKRRKKRSRRTIEADVTETKSNGSRWGMPSVERIVSKGLPYFVAALGFLNGAQGASSDCYNIDDIHKQCYEKGLMDNCYGPGYAKGVLITCLVEGCIAVGMILSYQIREKGYCRKSRRAGAEEREALLANS